MDIQDKSPFEIFIEYRQMTLRRMFEQQREKSRQQQELRGLEESKQPTESLQSEQSPLRFAIESFLDKCPRRRKSSRNR